MCSSPIARFLFIASAVNKGNVGGVCAGNLSNLNVRHKIFSLLKEINLSLGKIFKSVYLKLNHGLKINLRLKLVLRLKINPWSKIHLRFKLN